MLLLLLACTGPKVDPIEPTDSGEPPTSTVVDADGDRSPAGEDCDDDDPDVHPGATEECSDGVDQDCDGVEVGCTGVAPASSSSAWVLGDDDQWSFGFGHSIASTCAWSDDGGCLLVVGAPWAHQLEGEYNYSLTQGAALAVDVDEIQNGRSIGPSQAWSIQSWEDSQAFGEDLRIAEIDGDGVVDLVVGAPNNPGHADNTGDIYIFPGPITATNTPLITDGIRLSGDRGGLPLAYDVNPEWDVTGDGHRDIVIDRPGRCFEDTYGGFAVIAGPDFTSRRLDASVDHFWDSEQICWGNRHEVAVADFDGDGIGDVAMGSAQGGSGLRDSKSKSGVESDETGPGFVTISMGPLTEGGSLADSEGRIEGPNAWGGFGTSVEIMPDHDGDGLPELLVGSPGAGTAFEGGATIVPGPLVASWAGIDTLASVTVTGGGRENLFMGQGVFDGGDQDADGHRELLVAATYSDPGGVLDESGRVYVFRGPLQGTLEPADAVFTVHGDAAGDYLGYRILMLNGGGKLLGGVDLNDDGFDDWVVGAALEGQMWRGAVYTFFGGVWE